MKIDIAAAKSKVDCRKIETECGKAGIVTAKAETTCGKGEKGDERKFTPGDDENCPCLSVLVRGEEFIFMPGLDKS